MVSRLVWKAQAARVRPGEISQPASRSVMRPEQIAAFTPLPRGFTLVEALIAVVLLGFTVLAAASAEAWTARTIAGAERREDAAAAAELVLDSLALAPSVSSGEMEWEALRVEWRVEPGEPGEAVTVRVRVRPLGRALDGAAEEFGGAWALPPPSLKAGP